MLAPFDKIAVATPAGTYVIGLHYDLDPVMPDHPEDGGLVYLGDSRVISVQLGDAAHTAAELLRRYSATNDALWEHEYRSPAAIARYLRLAHGLTGVLEVHRRGDRYHSEEPSTNRYARPTGLAWSPADAPNPKDYTSGTVAIYDAWANGEVYGYILTAPDGREITSSWDFYADPSEPFTGDGAHGLGYMIREARAEAYNDADARVEQANAAGAGFLGLI